MVFFAFGNIRQHHHIIGLHCRLILTLASDACKAAPRSLFWTTTGLNELLVVEFKFPFNLTGNLTIWFFNRPVMVHTQIIVHRWGPRTRIIFGAVLRIWRIRRGRSLTIQEDLQYPQPVQYASTFLAVNSPRSHTQRFKNFFSRLFFKYRVAI